MLSAASSICLFASYSLLVFCNVSKVETTQTALLSLPVSDSFAANVPVLFCTISILVVLSQDLTSAVVAVVPPVTVSPTVKSPDPPATRPTVIALAKAFSIASISAIPVSYTHLTLPTTPYV